MAPVINVVMMPVLLLSGILLPMTIGPDWLQRTSDFMPFRWITDAVRGSFVGDFGGQRRDVGHLLGGGPVRPRALVGHGDLPQGERLTGARQPPRRR